MKNLKSIVPCFLLLAFFVVASCTQEVKYKLQVQNSTSSNLAILLISPDSRDYSMDVSGGVDYFESYYGNVIPPNSSLTINYTSNYQKSSMFEASTKRTMQIATVFSNSVVGKISNNTELASDASGSITIK